MEQKKKTGRELKSIFADRLEEARKRANCKSPNAFKNALADQEEDIEITAASVINEQATIPGTTKVSECLKKQLEEDETKKSKTYRPSFDKNTVPYWFDPEKHHVPNMLQLQRIHELCGCDIDYLLGNIDTFKKENNDICAETGLSEDCVNELRSIQKEKDHMRRVFLEQTSDLNPSEQDVELIKNDSSAIQLELISFLITHVSSDRITALDSISSKISHYLQAAIYISAYPEEIQDICKAAYESATAITDGIYFNPTKIDYFHEYIYKLKSKGYYRKNNTGDDPELLSSLSERFGKSIDDIQRSMEDAFFHIDAIENKADMEANNYFIAKELLEVINQFVEYKKQSLLAQE